MWRTMGTTILMTSLMPAMAAAAGGDPAAVSRAEAERADDVADREQWRELQRSHAAAEEAGDRAAVVAIDRAILAAIEAEQAESRDELATRQVMVRGAAAQLERTRAAKQQAADAGDRERWAELQRVEADDLRALAQARWDLGDVRHLMRLRGQLAERFGEGEEEHARIIAELVAVADLELRQCDRALDAAKTEGNGRSDPLTDGLSRARPARR